jgi:SAM-dependent methyltransferase
MRVGTGLFARSLRTFDALNNRHPWNHNDHFHGWILRHLPAARHRALDVGCGRGELLELLSRHFERVDGIDADAEMVMHARERLAHRAGASVTEIAFSEATGRYDLITMVAVLHHLGMAEALAHARELLSSGGRLLVVGLARPQTRLDVVTDWVSTLLNPVVGFVRHPRSNRLPSAPPSFPVKDPTLSYDEVRSEMERVLPGARLRHRLFFRYTAEWTSP